MKRKLYSQVFVIFILMLSSALSSAQELPVKGDVIITEFMANPAAVSDTKGEWFEIMNISDKTVLLNGLVFKDEGSNRFSIEGEEAIVLDAGSVYLLARSGNSSENGGISPDFSYKDYTLSNSEDEIILCLPDETVLDQVRYASGWDIEKGMSLELNPGSLNSSSHDDITLWNLATKAYGLGDLGSPGEINSNTSGLNYYLMINKFDVFPNPCYEKMTIDIELKIKADIRISLINIAGQLTEVYACPDCDILLFELETDWLEQGMWIVRLELGDEIVHRKIIVL